MTHDAADDVGQVLEPLADQAPDEAAQSELDLGVVSTGSADVDRALRPLDGLAERPVADHTEVFEQVLGDLAETMTGSGEAPVGVTTEQPETN
jgi:hypothetical protein